MDDEQAAHSLTLTPSVRSSFSYDEELDQWINRLIEKCQSNLCQSLSLNHYLLAARA